MDPPGGRDPAVAHFSHRGHPLASRLLRRHDPSGRSPYATVLMARQLGALSRGHRADEGLLRARLYADIRSPDGRGWRAGQHSSSPDSGHPTPGGQGGGLKQFWSRDTDSSRSAASSGSVTGGIFNLEYNADGSILAAACEQKSFLLFDPGSRRLVKTVEAAHRDCVNCVRFLDSRTFATCSDDTTVALWDARYLRDARSAVRVFRGHSNWVKNIEYSHRDGCLVTSGFDGAVYLWDINRDYVEGEGGRREEGRRVFYMNGLMRMRLSGPGDRMVVSTMNGFLMVVHDLELERLEEDLANFKPNMYRLMQLSSKPLQAALHFTRLFRAKRNRVEFVSDFAAGNDADVISSLRLHPQGWVAVSRNISSDEQTEWCSVHDVHAPPPPPDEGEEGDGADRRPTAVFRRGTGLSRLAEFLYGIEGPPAGNSRQEEEEEEDSNSGEDANDDDDENEEEEGEEDEPASADVLDAGNGRRSVRFRSPAASRSRMLLDALMRRRLQEAAQRLRREEQEGEDEPPVVAPPPPPRRGASARDRGVVLFSPELSLAGSNWVYFGTPREHRRGPANRTTSSSSDRPSSSSPAPPPGPTGQQDPEGSVPRIHHNRPRLTHYLEEANTGKGYIKEQCFSPCGRVVCSPFGFGLRLLAFSPDCCDLSDCPGDPEEGARRLCEVGAVSGECGHRDVVLSSCFAPSGYTLVTGCLGGRVVWHQPVL